MSKKISRAIAQRILKVEQQVFDELQLTAVKTEYLDFFMTIHDKVDMDTRDLLVIMDGLNDPIVFFAVRKAYYAGLQDGMKVGDSL